jgi:hypothetical protein
MARPADLKLSMEKKFDQLLAACELCLNNGYTTPALIILFSAIDAAAWVFCLNPSGPTKQRFVDWVKRYFLTAGRMECTALELYGARCALVHSLSPQSTLSQDGKARQILYATQGSDLEVLRRMTVVSNLEIKPDGRMAECSRYVAVHVNDLLSCFRQGLDSMFRESETNPALAERIRQRERKILETMSEKDAKAILDWGDQLLTVVSAARVEFHDKGGSAVCEADSECSARATVQIRGLDSAGAVQVEVDACEKHAKKLRYKGVVRDMR